ncbi:MAG TPA: SIS domain-containing protein [Candidatus Aquilonibacter sp.]
MSLAYHTAMVSLGINFEREIREQPDVWERIARSNAAAELAAALEGEIILIGSGSSLFAAQLGAVALRRRGISAHALAASEARGDNRAYRQRTIVALSQSGRSTDVLSALEVLRPQRTIALTNSVASPLGDRADLAIDVLAGPEIAIPASKSVSSTIAILLSTASLLGGDRTREPEMLMHTAETIRAWLAGSGVDTVVDAAAAIAARHDVMVLGTDYGAPIAREAALKFKEATYLHAEGFEAGEFRHGSAAMVDASSVVLGIMDRDAIEIVGRPLREAHKICALGYAVGTTTVDGITRLGPIVDDPYNTLAWLVTVQLLALYVARARDIDSDRPRGLTKAIVG